MGTHTSLDAVYRDINKQFDKVEKRSDEEVDKECLFLAENTLKEVKEDHFDLIAYCRASGLQRDRAVRLLTENGYRIVGNTATKEEESDEQRKGRKRSGGRDEEK